jgi:hypothetical protein
MQDERRWFADEIEAWANAPLVMSNPVTIDWSQVENLEAIIAGMRGATKPLSLEQSTAIARELDEILIHMVRARYQQRSTNPQ